MREYRTVFSRNDFIAANFFGVICRNYIIVYGKKINHFISIGAIEFSGNFWHHHHKYTYIITFHLIGVHIQKLYSWSVRRTRFLYKLPATRPKLFFFLLNIRFVETILNESRILLNIYKHYILFFIFVKVFN